MTYTVPSQEQDISKIVRSLRSLGQQVSSLPTGASGADFRGFIGGLTTSNNVGTPNTKLDISAGAAVDDAQTLLLSATAGTINCGTTGANGLDAGSLANSTFYYVYLIGKADGTNAFLASTSASSPTYPSGYTLKRRIGAFRTDGSAHILAFSQAGDEFTLSASIADVNDATLSTTSSLYALSVPIGFAVIARFRALIAHPTVPTVAVISSPYESDQAVDAVTGMRSVETAVTNVAAPAHYHVLTNASGQIRAVSSRSGTTIQIATFGWSDRRGKDG